MKNRPIYLLPVWAALFLYTACSGSRQDAQNTTDAPAPAAASADITEPLWRSIKRAGSPNGGRFFTDASGNKLFNGTTYHNAHEFRNGYCVVSQLGSDGKEKHGIINEKGEQVLPCENDYFIRDFAGGYFEIANPRIGYLDSTGKMVVPMEYTDSKGFNGGLVKLQKNYKKWGILNSKGEEVLPFVYDKIGRWGSNGLAAVQKGGSWGFADRNGREVIPCTYNFAYDFEHGIALVQKGKLYGFINANNETKIDFQFTNFKEITDVQKDEISETGFSSSNRRLVMEEGYIILEKAGKWGYIDTLGNVVIPFEYNYIGVPSRSGIVKIQKDKRDGSFDLNTKKETLK